MFEEIVIWFNKVECVWWFLGGMVSDLDKVVFSIEV